jgi:asparagine synthase (glutamine-hydrolysing)
MCGITGIVNLNRGKSVEPGILKCMTDVISHRGPDSEGFHIRHNVGLGMRRLSIIDLPGGDQPIYNEDSSVCIVYNGEVYNYKDLRGSLQLKGHKFVTRSDTEVIVHLYEEYGDDCVLHLRGMFAFAIWDDNKQRLLLARDRIGIKPLHYYFDPSKFVFGSEIKSIIRNPDIYTEMDCYAVDDYLTYGVVPAPRTIYKNIKKLPSGCILVYQDGNYTAKRYWKLNFGAEERKSEYEYIEELAELMKESVKMRLISDVSLGAFLSGGLDSSLVVALMNQVSDKPVKTFSIGFEDDTFNELKYARIVAEHCSTEHHEFVVKPDIEDELPGLLASFDEPFFDSSAIPTYFVSKMAREFVTVCLSGDGGDELFAGYNHYIRLQKMDAFIHPLSSVVHKDTVELLSKLLPFGVKGRNFLSRLPLSEAEYYAESSARFSRLEKRDICTHDFAQAIKGNNPYDYIDTAYKERGESNILERMTYADLMNYLPNDILTKVDRMSMLNSLEVRVPILDHVVVEYANKIPMNYKFNGKETKYIFRKMMEKFLPTQIAHRGKMGFAIPINKWLRGDLRNLCVDTLQNSEFVKMGIFKKDIVYRILKLHYSGKKDCSNLIWVLLCLEIWYRKSLEYSRNSTILELKGYEKDTGAYVRDSVLSPGGRS